MNDKVVREFATGANRDVDVDKLDFEGFLSPVVLEAFARYMHKNRTLRDGSIRDSDNWQKGIPRDVYMKSAWRHFFTWWELHRSGVTEGPAIEEHLCALLFNVQGYLFEALRPCAPIVTGDEWRMPERPALSGISVAWAHPPEDAFEPPPNDGLAG